MLRAFLTAIAFALALVAQDQPAGALDLPRGELRVAFSNTRIGTLVMTWQGPIAAPMANQIRDAFENRKGQATRLVLRLSSHGGSVAEGERVIEVLRQIKSTHQLDTVVSQGDVCGSMCVFIYVQGQKRFGALTSSWLFHEVSHTDPATKQTIKLDRTAWERLVDKYFRPAGVSDAWITDLKPRTIEADYWQTGADLIRSSSGIIHEPIANQTARLVTPGGGPKAAASAQPSAASPRECRKYFASIGAVVTVPCS
jgi:ATP-dependent protease ClpP protease subunit